MQNAFFVKEYEKRQKSRNHHSCHGCIRRPRNAEVHVSHKQNIKSHVHYSRADRKPKSQMRSVRSYQKSLKQNLERPHRPCQNHYRSVFHAIRKQFFIRSDVHINFFAPCKKNSHHDRHDSHVYNHNKAEKTACLLLLSLAEQFADKGVSTHFEDESYRHADVQNRKHNVNCRKSQTPDIIGNNNAVNDCVHRNEQHTNHCRHSEFQYISDIYRFVVN